jgi:hypothetical protein
VPIARYFNIKVGPFINEEYINAKKALVEGNSTAEKIKKCDLDDVVLSYFTTRLC